VNSCVADPDFLRNVPNTQAVCSLQVITLASVGDNLRSKSRTDPSAQPTAIIAPIRILQLTDFYRIKDKIKNAYKIVYEPYKI
jgi:hypothetical protein